MTDDPLAELLRETFADKEKLADDLPLTRTAPAVAVTPVRRHAGPVLVAAAAVVLVLGAVVVAVRSEPGSTTGPLPAATSSVAATPAATTAPAEVRIWAAAIVGILEREQRTTWPTVHVLDAPHHGSGAGLTRGTPFTAAQRAAIAAEVGSVAPIQWVARRPIVDDICQPTRDEGPVVTLGPIVHRAGHVEVATSYWESCLSARWLTFRLDESNGTWRVTGTVGPERVS